VTCRTGDALVAARAYSLHSVTCMAIKPHDKQKEERGGCKCWATRSDAAHPPPSQPTWLQTLITKELIRVPIPLHYYYHYYILLPLKLFT